MRALHREHRRIDAEVAERIVDSLAVDLSVLEQRRSQRLNRGPDRSQRLLRDVEVPLRLAQEPVVIGDAQARQPDHREKAVATGEPSRVLGWNSLREYREANLLIELLRSSSCEQVLGGEAREGNLHVCVGVVRRSNHR